MHFIQRQLFVVVISAVMLLFPSTLYIANAQTATSFIINGYIDACDPDYFPLGLGEFHVASFNTDGGYTVEINTSSPTLFAALYIPSFDPLNPLQNLFAVLPNGTPQTFTSNIPQNVVIVVTQLDFSAYTIELSTSEPGGSITLGANNITFGCADTPTPTPTDTPTDTPLPDTPTPTDTPTEPPPADTPTPTNTQIPACVIVSRTEIIANEGAGTALYNIRLSRPPALGETVNVFPMGFDTNDITVSPANRQLNASNWFGGRNFGVTAIDDLLVEGTEFTTISHTTTSNIGGSAWSGAAACSTITVSIHDNDA